MTTPSNFFPLALQHHQAGNLAQAEQYYRLILQADPANPDAHHLLGVCAAQQGRHEQAITSIRQAIALNNAIPAYHGNLALAHNNLGVELQRQQKLDDAVGHFKEALQLKPDFAEAYCNLGLALTGQGRLDEASAACNTALRLNPQLADAHNNLGNALRELGKLNDAAASYHEALRINPRFAEAHGNLGIVLMEQNRLVEAAACYRQALAINPDYALALTHLGHVLRDQDQTDEAVACYRRALDLQPDNLAVLAVLVQEMQRVCQWHDLESLSQRLIEKLDRCPTRGVTALVSPLDFMALPTPTTAMQQLECARHWVNHRLRSFIAAGERAAWPHPPRKSGVINVGYLSTDFREHPVAYLTVEIFEQHDRDRFKVMGYSYGQDDHSPIRRRIEEAFDRFVDVSNETYMETARRIAADGIDILVDLTGHTRNSRAQILALRPAPIQVNYIGYPGTMGATFMDYILVDDFIVPPDQQPFFTEKLVHLPGCYQVNDSQRSLSEKTPSRAECGLPADGFVFCCFNKNQKITPAVFEVWMQLLKAVGDSVLWLLQDNRHVAANLRREATARGVAAERLVFAPRTPLPEHLARHRLADLFLDTLPYNAHTTASDALWAGCPVLTITGPTFVSRVAGSVLRTIGLPELVTGSLEEHHGLALRLARDRKLLAEWKARLQTNLKTSRLFDGGLFARGLERAYTKMWEIHAAGAKPRSFKV